MALIPGGPIFISSNQDRNFFIINYINTDIFVNDIVNLRQGSGHYHRVWGPGHDGRTGSQDKFFRHFI